MGPHVPSLALPFARETHESYGTAHGLPEMSKCDGRAEKRLPGQAGQKGRCRRLATSPWSAGRIEVACYEELQHPVNIQSINLH